MPRAPRTLPRGLLYLQTVHWLGPDGLGGRLELLKNAGFRLYSRMDSSLSPFTGLRNCHISLHLRCLLFIVYPALPFARGITKLTGMPRRDLPHLGCQRLCRVSFAQSIRHPGIGRKSLKERQVAQRSDRNMSSEMAVRCLGDPTKSLASRSKRPSCMLFTNRRKFPHVYSKHNETKEICRNSAMSCPSSKS
jgi:hypothetical protein